MDESSAALAAATVLSRAFAIPGDPTDLAASFAPLPAQGPALAWTVELVANDAEVAFLVSAYELGDAPGGPDSGQVAMAADLAVMAKAAAKGTPGPRLVARAEAGGWGIVVAASPAAVARLGGTPDAVPVDKPAAARERARAADALLAALRNAERRSATYLAAVGDGTEAPTTAERGLALFVADAPSLANLSRALRLAVARADPGHRPPEADPT